MKIYTRTGDAGQTGLFAGGRVSKAHGRIEAIGAIDELNAAIGVARAASPSREAEKWLEAAQTQLFHLGSDLATPLDAKTDWIVRVDAAQARWLEETMDEMTAQLPPLRNFILPGGCMAAAQLHLARAICRRAERAMAALHEQEALNPDAMAYVNRLSDWLFTLARYENMRAGMDETKWAPRE